MEVQHSSDVLTVLMFEQMVGLKTQQCVYFMGYCGEGASKNGKIGKKIESEEIESFVNELL